jgi:hypothetical protein
LISPWMQRPGDWGTCTGKRWLSHDCLQRFLSFHNLNFDMLL